MTVAKPYLRLNELVDRMCELGLDIGQRDMALAVLTTQSYHRLRGYRYVFRKLLPVEEQDLASLTFRHDEYIAGSTLSDVVALAAFDAKLRAVVLEGAVHFEVALRNALTEQLGAKSPLAHRMIEHLDPATCNAQARPGASHGENLSKLEAWLGTCDDAERDASLDDFVAHFRRRYEGATLPIWATLEVMNFGSLAFLFDLMTKEDRLGVARRFGFKHFGPFGAGIRQIVDIRNHCAHGARLYNRNMKRRVDLNMKGAPSNLKHLAELSPENDRKLYPVAAVLASALRAVNPTAAMAIVPSDAGQKVEETSLPTGS